MRIIELLRERLQSERDRKVPTTFIGIEYSMQSWERMYVTVEIEGKENIDKFLKTLYEHKSNIVLSYSDENGRDRL